MPVKLWVATGAGTASTASNWLPSGAPGVFDTARFAINSNNCEWDIATSVNAIAIESTYTGVVEFTANASLVSYLSLEAENCITANSSKSITFTGTAFFNTNQTYVKNNCTDPFVNAAGRENLEYVFTGNGSTPVLLDTGKYPHVRYNGSKFLPKYVSNTLSTNANKISMQSFTYETNSSVSHEIPTQNDRDLRWEIDGQLNASASNSFNIPYTNNIELFDGGYGTWDFQAGFRFPTSSSSLYGNFNQVGLRFVWRNVELSNRAGATNPQTILQGTLYLDNLTVNSGIFFGNRPSAGATLLTINRPKIRGTLGLKQVADGMYISGTPNLDVAYGGTGLSSIPQGRIPFGNSDEKMATNSNFTFISDLLSAGNGITLNPISSQPSTSNTLWLNSLASNSLYLDGAAVGGGGGGGGISGITIQDEGVSLGTATTTLNFVDGQHAVQTVPTPQPLCVQATGTGSSKTITIDGSKVRTDATDTLPAYLDAKINAGSNMTISLDTSLAASVGHKFVFSADNNKVGISSADTTPNFLENKLVAGSNITLTKQNAGGNETIEISSSGGGGGGSSGYPLFRHDDNPTTHNFKPFRLLADGDTIKIGQGSTDVSVFSPILSQGGSIDTITADNIGSVSANTGREYIFYGQLGKLGGANHTKYKLDTVANTGVKTFWISHMGVIGNGILGTTPVASELIIIGLPNTSNVRVIDAGEHDIKPLDGSEEEFGGFPDPEQPTETCRLLLIDHYQYYFDGKTDPDEPLFPNFVFNEILLPKGKGGKGR